MTLSFLLAGWLCSVGHAEDLVTRDGAVYKNYKVLSHDAGFVTIMYADGGGKIPLSQLPDDLQKKYGYDPATASAAAKAATEQERRDRQALQAEELAHQRAMQAAAQSQAATASPNPAPVAASTAAGGSPPESLAPAGPSAAGTPAPLPKGGMTWPEMEQLSAKIGALLVEMAHLKASIGGSGLTSESAVAGTTASARSMGADGLKLRNDQTLLDQLDARFSAQQQFVDTERIPGPVLSEGEIHAKKDELKSLEEDVAHKGNNPYLVIEKSQRILLLKLEVKYANASALGSPAKRHRYTWEEAKAMGDRQVALFDEIAEFSSIRGDVRSVEQAHKVEVDNDVEEQASLKKQQAEFADQLARHTVRGHQLSGEELDALKAQIAATDEEQARLTRNNAEGTTYKHMIAADQQALWLMKLQLKYAND